MGLCIGVSEKQLPELIKMLGENNKRFAYKFLTDTDNYDLEIEKTGAKILNDCLIFTGIEKTIRRTNFKNPGKELMYVWNDIFLPVFEEERQVAIVNDYWDYPSMVLVFPHTVYDYSADSQHVPIALEDHVLDACIFSLLKKLNDEEGLNTIMFKDFRARQEIPEDEGIDPFFKMKQEKIQQESRERYKDQIVDNFKNTFKFRMIAIYTKLRQFGLDDIMRKLNDFGFLDERFDGEIYVYEEEARRLLARRICAMSFRHDIEILIKEGLIEQSMITYDYKR
jgi:hypothetical protein